MKGIERILRVCFEFYDLQASTMYFELGFFLVGERGDVKAKNGRVRGMDVLNMFEQKIQRLNKKQHRKVYFGNDYHFHGMVV